MMHRIICAAILLTAMSMAATAADKPGTVEAKGFRVTAAPAKQHFPTGESITVTVTFTNASKRPYQLFDANFWMYEVNTPNSSWQCALKNTKTGKEYRPTVTIRPMIARIAQPVTLMAGKTHQTVVRLGRQLSYRPLGAAAGKVGPGLMPGLMRRSPLPDGTYQLALTIELRKTAGRAMRRPPANAPFWAGTVKLTTAAFQVGGAVKVEPGKWVALFADQRWYKRQAGKEQVFTGVLKVKPKAPAGMVMGTTLMRTSYYTLGDRTIYTGARRVPVLEALGGKKVEIRGKPVEMNLEGQHLKEIWPAAVRLVKDVAKKK